MTKRWFSSEEACLYGLSIVLLLKAQLEFRGFGGKVKKKVITL
jgi:hypothetical protein